ncbi:hypothetical protein NEIMUCOT_06686 [Neisseria mucosa ATCC 25996]|uniref:Uncharacterized protein n=1 Tax=Neisseria mucosa (strain ATCC 25996 / DSM 4631 / NCTC 10774 / M26) TaxID=546266 RepID=D3A192_NEIM2|nr:hypothetical protein NEIMUCOT_06686 [Neisseria mucosa ATCC 25996]
MQELPKRYIALFHSVRREEDRFNKQKRPLPSGTGRFLVWPSYSPAISRIRG